MSSSGTSEIRFAKGSPEAKALQAQRAAQNARHGSSSLIRPRQNTEGSSSSGNKALGGKPSMYELASEPKPRPYHVTDPNSQYQGQIVNESLGLYVANGLISTRDAEKIKEKQNSK